MPEQEHRKIEQLLRRYARERRGGPPLSLHPATRRMLQGEVRRVYGHGSGHSSESWVRQHWRRLAFGTAVAAITLGGILTMHPPGTKNRTTGMAESVPAKEPSIGEDFKFLPRGETVVTSADDGPLPAGSRLEMAVQQPPVEATASAEMDALAVTSAITGDSVAVAAAPETSALNLGVNPVVIHPEEVSVPASAKAESTPEPVSLAVAPAAKSARQTVAKRPPPALPAISGERWNRAAALTNLGAALRVRFQQVTNDQSAAPYPVFRSFQMEQLGEQIRFVDSDGSVYTGAIQPVATGLPLQQGEAMFTRATNIPPNPDAFGVATFSFQAAGTNRTLEEPVVVTGSYFEKTNRLPGPENTFSVNPRDERPQNLASPEAAAVKSISGTAVVGGTNEVRFRAVSPDGSK